MPMNMIQPRDHDTDGSRQLRTHYISSVRGAATGKFHYGQGSFLLKCSGSECFTHIHHAHNHDIIDHHNITTCSPSMYGLALDIITIR